MEVLLEKAKLADERIAKLRELVTRIGPIDPRFQLQSLEEENQRLKAQVQGLVQELTKLETERGVNQHYDFTNKIPKAPTSQASKPEAPTEPIAATCSKTATASATEQPNKDDKKKKPVKEEKPAKPTANKVNDITRFDLRVGKILSVEKHPDADSLYVEQIDVGEEKPRTVCSGLVKHMAPSDLDQKLVIVLCNLKPAKMRGITSEAMVMCASTPDKVELMQPSDDCKPGDRIECDGYDCSSPDAQVKKELCDQILPDMKTNEQGEATYKGAVWRVANGKGLIKSKSLVGVPIK